jgi:hypothetical protein
MNETIHPDDVVFFYYTGHGLRTDKSQTIWPSIYLPAKQEMIDVHDLVNTMITRPASLYITIADCCNNVVHDTHSSDGFSPPLFAKSQPLSRSAYKKLFLKSRGLIIASGSVPGKRSWCTQKGGVFTNAFLTSLRHELGAVNPSWNHILTQSKMLCQHLQKAQFQVSIQE